jgi:hypothetical protein
MKRSSRGVGVVCVRHTLPLLVGLQTSMALAGMFGVVPRASAQAADEWGTPVPAPNEVTAPAAGAPADEGWSDSSSSADDGWGDGSSGSDGGGGGGSFAAEPSLTVNGMFRFQAGVFAPLFSDKFKPHENRAFVQNSLNELTDIPCDPVATPYAPCRSVDHGQEPGSLSIGRATMQFEANWDAVPDKIALHAIVRGVRSLKLPGDRYAQIPQMPTDPDERRQAAQDFAHANYYTELSLREFYLDLSPFDNLSFRIGKQQVAWGETSAFRLLDVVNPVNATWHFGPLENMEDQRIPLWMINTTITVPKADASLELLLIPTIPRLNRPQDMVTVPLTFVGAWGVPYSNAPVSFFTPNKVFLYPGGDIRDSRAGARWKQNVGNHLTYSLIYYYTHQINMPIPKYMNKSSQPLMTPNGPVDLFTDYVLDFPRQHIAGGTLEYAFDSPIGTLLRFEGSVEPNKTYPSRTDIGFTADPRIANRFNYRPLKQTVINYGVSLQRSTMIRFLNPTQSFILFAQFLHSYVPTLDVTKGDQSLLVDVPLYNAWQAQKHTFNVVFMARTTYLHGKISPRVTAAYLPNIYTGDSGFYSIDVDFRLATNYALNLRFTDFFGGDAYRELGLFRDRDELHASITAQF